MSFYPVTARAPAAGGRQSEREGHGDEHACDQGVLVSAPLALTQPRYARREQLTEVKGDRKLLSVLLPPSL